MQGRKCLFLAAAFLFAGCSPQSIMKPDCHSCTVEDQEWNAFSWNSLNGQWKGFMETLKSTEGQAKKEKSEKAVSLRFLNAGSFLQARGASSCGSLPAEAVVLNGQLWERKDVTEFEAFVPSEEGKVAYGRLAFEKVNGKEICRFHQMGAVMGQNRLALPTVSFSEGRVSGGRGLASLADENEYSLEFLRFDSAGAKSVAFRKDGRKPAAVDEQERPQLILRISKVSSRQGGQRGQWSGSEEQIYRLWKAD